MASRRQEFCWARDCLSVARAQWGAGWSLLSPDQRRACLAVSAIALIASQDIGSAATAPGRLARLVRFAETIIQWDGESPLEGE